MRAITVRVQRPWNQLQPMEWILACTAAALFVLGLASIASGLFWMRAHAQSPEAQDAPSPKKPTEMERALAGTLFDSSGEAHDLQKLRRGTVVFEWIDPSCSHSVRQHRTGAVRKISDAWRKHGVRWLGVVSESKKSARQIEAFRRAFRVRYPILHDADGTLARALGAKTSLHMFVLQDGSTVYEGAFDDNPTGKKLDPVNFVDDALAKAKRGRAVAVSYREPYGKKIRPASHRERQPKGRPPTQD